MSSEILLGAVVGLVIGLVIVVSHKGSRFKKLVSFTGDFDKMSARIDDFLAASNFHIQNYGSETVYCKGSRLLVGRKFIKFSRAPEGVLVEAFINLFGSNESGIDGFVGAVAKKQLKATVDQVIAMIEAGEQGNL
ncbi:MAG: hypothetical protein FWH56_12540 [Betaproteobacteria bacterium]|nr:hypothetical protein [Betaproteobacteria bacterium]